MGPDHFYSPPSLLCNVQTISTAHPASCHGSRPFPQPTQPLVMGPDHSHSPPSFSTFVQTISAAYPVSSLVSRPFLQPHKPPILCPDNFYSPPSLLSCVQIISPAHMAFSYVGAGISFEVKYSACWNCRTARWIGSGGLWLGGHVSWCEEVNVEYLWKNVFQINITNFEVCIFYILCGFISVTHIHEAPTEAFITRWLMKSEDRISLQ